MHTNVAEARTICLFFCTWDPDKIALLYKFDINISSSIAGHGHDNDIVVLAEDRHILFPTTTFSQQDIKTRDFSCGIIGSKLFVVPSESEMDSDFVNKMKNSQVSYEDVYKMRLSRTNRLHPLQFDFLNNRTDFINYPRAPKKQPYLIPIHDKLYALSIPAATWDYYDIEPSFEAYDTTTGSWETLPAPPFYDNEPYSCSVPGYAVVTLPQGDDDERIYIVVLAYFSERADAGFFSYNTRRREWKPVSLAKGAEYPEWTGETVVVGGHIYVYSPDDLRAFPIRYCEETDVFSLGLPFRVKGLWMREPPEMGDYHGIDSTSIGIIRDRLLCVVSTSFPDRMTTQFVLVSIVQIWKEEPSRCDTLNSFIFGIPQEGEKRNSLMIRSSFALAPGVTSSMEQIEEGKNQILQDCTDYDDASSSMEMTSYMM